MPVTTFDIKNNFLLQENRLGIINLHFMSMNLSAVRCGCMNYYVFRLMIYFHSCTSTTSLRSNSTQLVQSWKRLSKFASNSLRQMLIFWALKYIAEGRHDKFSREFITLKLIQKWCIIFSVTLWLIILILFECSTFWLIDKIIKVSCTYE